jgi:hypothetical protein
MIDLPGNADMRSKSKPGLRVQRWLADVGKNRDLEKKLPAKHRMAMDSPSALNFTFSWRRLSFSDPCRSGVPGQSGHSKCFYDMSGQKVKMVRYHPNARMRHLGERLSGEILS